MLFSTRSRSNAPDITNLQTQLAIALTFLSEIADGNFSVAVPPEIQGQESHQQFVSLLTRVRDTLSENVSREAERQWIAEGISQFISLTAGDSGNRDDFYSKILRFIVQYTAANQAGLFLVNDDDTDDIHLEMVACYAYGKKKFLEKRVNIGEGITGQCYLEKETVRLRELPLNYTRISSGLGEATPRFLLVIPIQFNGAVQGVIELAYFQECADYQIEFLEKIAEHIASITLNYRSARKAEVLFEESQAKARLLQEQEETLRQSVEELLATQEEMKRNQLVVERQARLMKFIIDNIPFPIFVKDVNGRYTMVNKAESALFGVPDHELIGRDDSHFVSRAEEWDLIRQSDKKVLEDNQPVELPLQHFTTGTGKSHVFKTTKIPFFNEVTGEKNILGVSIDLTEQRRLQAQLNSKLEISN